MYQKMESLKAASLNSTVNQPHQNHNISESSESKISPKNPRNGAKKIFEFKTTATVSPKRGLPKYSSVTRVTKTNKNPKFISKVSPNLGRAIDCSLQSSTRSIGKEVRETIKTKTMTDMKLSFDSNPASDKLTEYLHGRIFVSGRDERSDTPDSQVILNVSYPL